MNNRTTFQPLPTVDRGSPPRRSSYDVIVVGARVAGAATAMLLARRGLSVLAIDRGRYGADVVSTHSIAPPGVFQLSRWGVLERIRDTTPVTRTVHFDYSGEVVELDITARGDVDGMYNPRRTVLDPALVDAAVAAGAEVCHGVTMTGIRWDAAGRVGGIVVNDGDRIRSIAARVVVGADGVRSRVADEVGAAVLHREHVAMATIYAYFDRLDVLRSDRIENYYRDGRVMGYVPTNDDAMLVWVGLRSDDFKRQVGGDPAGAHARFVDDFAGPRETLGALPRVSGFRSFRGAPGFLRQSWGAGWVLAGDAAYFKDPSSAHGITDALIGAELVADAVTNGLDGSDEREAFVHMQDLRNVMAAEMMPHAAAAAALPADPGALKGAWIGMSRAMRSEWDLIESEFGAVAVV